MMHINLYQAIQQADKIDALGKSQANVKQFANLMEYLRQRSATNASMEKLVRKILNQTTLLSYYERIGQKEAIILWWKLCIPSARFPPTGGGHFEG
jgi:hypothetical protein